LKIQEGYQLYLKWNRIRYDEQIAHFTGAVLTGPVLSQAQAIEPNDFIDLDFTKQNANVDLFLPQHFFIARLAWKDVVYKDNMVELKRCTLIHNKAGSLKELKNDFSFVVDCSGHEEHMHKNMLVYPAWVLNGSEDVI
jgi:hypothetical protein